MSDQQTYPTEPTPPRMDVPSSDLLALIAFLAGYLDQLHELRWELHAMSDEDCKLGLIGKWPMIQGTRNQMNLSRIGKMPWSSEQVTRAVAGILKANTFIHDTDVANSQKGGAE